MADVIVILRDGYIEQVGAPLQVYDHPANLFVAEFIGSPNMNILPGEVASQNGALVVNFNSVALPLPTGAPVRPGQKVVYGIRPEHLKPSLGSEGIATKIGIFEPTGPEIHIYAELGGEEVCSITQDRLAFNPGADIRLVPDLTRVHLFDQESGKSLHG